MSVCYNTYMKYLLTITYDGTNFAGFQRQANGERTIQAELERTLQILLKQDISVVASGRTDAGVHAYNQVVHFECDGIGDDAKFLRSVNGILPSDVKAKTVQPTQIHARFSAKKKTYLYKMYIGDIDLPLFDKMTRIPSNSNIDAMKSAGKLLLGEHDFANFCASGSGVKSTIRTIYSIKWKQSGEYLDFYITGNGFLYKMVRNIIGSLIEVGKGKISVADYPTFAFGKFTKRHTAPANSLFLYNVKY